LRETAKERKESKELKRNEMDGGIVRLGYTF